MYLVDIYNCFAFLTNAVHDALYSFLEIASELRSGKQRTEVERVYAVVFKTFRHLALLYQRSQSVHESSLSHPRFAYMQRVVLILTAQHLYGTLQFCLTPYEWIVVGKLVVDAGHEFTPQLAFDIMLHSILDVFIVIRVADIHIFIVCSKDIGNYLCLRQVGIVDKKIMSLRVAQMQNGINEMWDVNFFLSGTKRLCLGIVHHITCLV